MAKKSVSQTLLDFTSSNSEKKDWEDVWGPQKPTVPATSGMISTSAKKAIDARQAWLLGRRY